MDPTTAWENIRTALRDAIVSERRGDKLTAEGSREELCWNLQNLAEWIDRGGFLPVLSDREWRLLTEEN